MLLLDTVHAKQDLEKFAHMLLQHCFSSSLLSTRRKTSHALLNHVSGMGHQGEKHNIERLGQLISQAVPQRRSDWTMVVNQPNPLDRVLFQGSCSLFQLQLKMTEKNYWQLCHRQAQSVLFCPFQRVMLSNLFQHQHQQIYLKSSQCCTIKKL